MPRGLQGWKFNEVIQFLKKNGFELHRKSKGSHFHYKKVTKNKSYLVTVASHRSKTIPAGTLNSIIRQSGIDKKYWRKNKK